MAAGKEHRGAGELMGSSRKKLNRRISGGGCILRNQSLYFSPAVIKCPLLPLSIPPAFSCCREKMEKVVPLYAAVPVPSPIQAYKGAAGAPCSIGPGHNCNPCRYTPDPTSPNSYQQTHCLLPVHFCIYQEIFKHALLDFPTPWLVVWFMLQSDDFCVY